jgi:hypothetical protein
VNHQQLVLEIKNIVHEACKSDSNAFGYGIWTHHIIRVVNNAKELAGLFHADLEIVEIAALLHDYAGIKDKNLHQEHHIHGADEAERILKSFNYPEAQIQKVKECILNHRGSRQYSKLSPEAECLTNADAIAHIENLDSLFYLVYVKFGMSIDEGSKWIEKKIKRSWNKISPVLKQRIESKYISALEILSSRDLIAEC